MLNQHLVNVPTDIGDLPTRFIVRIRVLRHKMQTPDSEEWPTCDNNYQIGGKAGDYLLA